LVPEYFLQTKAEAVDPIAKLVPDLVCVAQFERLQPTQKMIECMGTESDVRDSFELFVSDRNDVTSVEALSRIETAMLLSGRQDLYVQDNSEPRVRNSALARLIPHVERPFLPQRQHSKKNNEIRHASSLL
jgi:hypothetical protein